MTQQSIQYRQDAQGVVRITLNRPDKRNAFDDRIIGELTAALRRAGQDPACRLVVLAGNGKHFSAGADLNWMQRTAAMSEADNIRDARALAELMRALDRLAKPTLARIQGAAFGGALGLICACDIAVAADSARFCFSEARLGLAPAAISPYVVRAMGPRQARRYFLTTEELGAEEARSCGLVHQVVPEADLDETVHTLIQRLLANGPIALEACKALVARATDDKPDTELLDYTAEVIARLRTGAEGQEGLQAFLDKRRPAWIKE